MPIDVYRPGKMDLHVFLARPPVSSVTWILIRLASSKTPRALIAGIESLGLEMHVRGQNRL